MDQRACDKEFEWLDEIPPGEVNEQMDCYISSVIKQLVQVNPNINNCFAIL
jgi:hypothetical protein